MLDEESGMALIKALQRWGMDQAKQALLSLDQDEQV